MQDTEMRQEVFTFAQAQLSATDIDAMRKQEALLVAEVEEHAERVKTSAEYTDLQEAKGALKSVREQIAQATGALVDGLVGSGK